MLIQFAAYFAIAAFVGLVVLGHVLLFWAIFTRPDHADGKSEKLPMRGIVNDLRL